MSLFEVFRVTDSEIYPLVWSCLVLNHTRRHSAWINLP